MVVKKSFTVWAFVCTTGALILISIFLVLHPTHKDKQNTPALNMTIEIDLGATTEKSAETYLRTNVVAYVHEALPETVWNKFFAEQRVGDILIDTVSITRDSTDMLDLERRIHSIDALVNRVVEAGGRVQLVFQHGIPKWLSSDPQNESGLFGDDTNAGEKIWQSVPPADFSIWEKVAHAFVHHFNNELSTKGRVYYVVGSEPENYWVGNEDAWMQYYEHFVKGARTADPEAIVGGINTVGIRTETLTKSNPRTTKDGTVVFETSPVKGDKGLVYNWLKYSAQNKLPVDLIAWHDYPAPSPVPGETANWVVAQQQLDEWLSEFGYRDVELILNDWPEWKPVPHDNDSEFQAAYVVNSLITMLDHTRVKPLYLGMQDLGAFTVAEERARNASFGGGNGLFTGIGVAKPVYNAYSLMSKMQGQLVQVQTGDEYVRGLASVDGDTVYLLLVNFIPSERIILQNTYGIDGGKLSSEDRRKIQDIITESDLNKQEILTKVLDGSIKLEQLDLPEEVLKKANGMRQVFNEGQRRLSGPAFIQVNLSKLDPEIDTWSYQHYVVDKSHANSYTARLKVLEESEIPQNKEALGALVNKVNKSTNITSGIIEEKSVHATNGTVNLDISLEPQSVHLIVLQK